MAETRGSRSTQLSVELKSKTDFSPDKHRGKMSWLIAWHAAIISRATVIKEFIAQILAKIELNIFVSETEYLSGKNLKEDAATAELILKPRIPEKSTAR